jgi:hypothetical protein
MEGDASSGILMLRPALRLDDGLIHTVPRDDSLQPAIYCPPEHLIITGPMVIDMIRDGMKDHPDWGEESFNHVAFLALKRTFPCKPQ